MVVNRFSIATPISYVNSTPHVGHAYTTIAADIVTRHHRQRRKGTFFLTGTDEHASKNVRSAQEQGLDPKTFVDRIVDEHWRPLPGLMHADVIGFVDRASPPDSHVDARPPAQTGTAR